MRVTQTHQLGHPQNPQIESSNFTTQEMSKFTISSRMMGIRPTHYKSHKNNQNMHSLSSYEGYNAIFHVKRTNFQIFEIAHLFN